MDWEAAERVQKNAAGEYRALIGGEWVPASKAQKNEAGQFRVLRAPKPINIDPKQGFADALRQELKNAGWVGRNLAAIGTAPANLWESGKQLFGLGNAQNIEAQRIIAEEAPAGAIAGNVATYAPLAMVPGANTVAGGALIGAATGAAQPTLEGESRLSNAATGAVVGAAVPAALKVGKTIKAAVVDPFTEAGRNRIAGDVLNRSAADAKAAAVKMTQAKGATPGFTPTAGQAADDAGIAALERTTRAVNPGAFDDVDRSQRQSLADAVRGIAKDDIQRGAAVTARDNAVQPLYDMAKKATVEADPALDTLLQRPSMQAAAGRATNLAAERGGKFLLARPTAAKTIQTGVLDASGNPISKVMPGNPASYSGQALHDLKRGLDDAIGVPGQGGMQGEERAAAIGTKDAYLDWLASKIPEYGEAKDTYAALSRPINQMDIGQVLADKLIPALYRDMPAPTQLNASAFARALSDQGDDIARRATGMKGARLSSIMDSEQMNTLRGVASDLQLMKSAENAGRGVGSDTVQKTAMSHIAAQAGIPNWMSSVARVPGGWVKRIGDAVYGNSDDAVRMMMADLLKNPQEAAKAMEAAGVNPSVMANLLQNGAQGMALSTTPMMLNQ